MGNAFPPGTSVVEQIDPDSGVHAPVLAGLRTAIDVLVGDDEHTSLFVVRAHPSVY